MIERRKRMMAFRLRWDLRGVNQTTIRYMQRKRSKYGIFFFVIAVGFSDPFDLPGFGNIEDALVE